MNPRIRAWLLIITVLVGCGLMVWGGFWYRARAITPAEMFRRLPVDNAVVVYIDFAQLRSRHILDLMDSTKVGSDPEYQSFIQKTNFNYRQDLDTAMVSFAPSGKYMVLRGRFYWKDLKDYVIAMDGRCNNSLCKMVGSTPERRISFFPLQKTVMALAVSQDESAVERLNALDQRAAPQFPNAPVWLMIPPAILESSQSLPEGTQMFAHRLAKAQGVMLWLAADGTGYAARLDVRCANVGDAVEIASQLTQATNLLRRVIESEDKKPNPADLSGMLTSGTFHNEGTRVLGGWPIPQALIENLLGQ